MQFDQRGHLTPYEIIETNLETFENVFVSEIKNSRTRLALFEEYREFLAELQQIIGANFYQWIDGSFTTQRRNPSDIDLVTFLDGQRLNQFAAQLSPLQKRKFQSRGKIDAYFVATYPKGHALYDMFWMDHLDWLHQFEKDTRLKGNPRKGIIQLIR